jgi:hypothetical protein
MFENSAGAENLANRIRHFEEVHSRVPTRVWSFFLDPKLQLGIEEELTNLAREPVSK